MSLGEGGRNEVQPSTQVSSRGGVRKQGNAGGWGGGGARGGILLSGMAWECRLGSLLVLEATCRSRYWGESGGDGEDCREMT